MADYFVLLDTGRVQTIAGVTATPTIVDNDGTATMLKGPAYRNIFPPQELTVSGTMVQLTGARIVPAWTVAAGSATLDAIDVITDDVTKDPVVEPVQPDEIMSHWKFVVGAFSYFIPVKHVVSMGTTAAV